MTAQADQLVPVDALPRRATRAFAHRWDLVLTLIGRDLKLRYNRSVMGIAWSFVTPLSQLLVLNLVFTRVVPLGIPAYGSFLLVGLLTWTWFSISLDQATGSIVDHRELVRQPGFPVGLLPVITVATNLVQFLLALPVLALVIIVAGISLGPALVVLPLLIAVQFLFTLGLSFFIATFHVTFRHETPAQRAAAPRVLPDAHFLSSGASSEAPGTAVPVEPDGRPHRVVPGRPAGESIAGGRSVAADFRRECAVVSSWIPGVSTRE